MKKICKKHGELQEKDICYLKKTGKVCRICKNENNKLYAKRKRITNPDHLRNISKKTYEKLKNDPRRLENRKNIQKKWYELNKDSILKRRKEYYINNREKVRLTKKLWLNNIKENDRERYKEMLIKKREEYLKRHREFVKKQVDDLSDIYIKWLFSHKNRRTGVKSKLEISPKLIELKRIILKIKREVKNVNKNS